MIKWFNLVKNKMDKNYDKTSYKALVILKNNGGNKRVRIKKEYFIPMIGSIFFTPLGVEIDIEDGIDYYILYLDKEFRNKFLFFLGEFEKKDFHFSDDLSIRKGKDFISSSYEKKNCIFFQLHYDELRLLKISFQNSINVMTNEGETLQLLALIESATMLYGFLIKRLEESNQSANDVNYQIVEKVKTYINENLHKKLNLTIISSCLGINSKDLNFTFRLIEKKTICEYILSEKISLASKMLFDEDREIDEIINRIGIKDPAYFYRIFKKKTGYTPREYRKNNLLTLGIS